MRSFLGLVTTLGPQPADRWHCENWYFSIHKFHAVQSQFHRRRTSLWIICLQVALSLIVTNTQGSVPRPAASLLSPEVKTQQNIPAMLVRWRNLSVFFFPLHWCRTAVDKGGKKTTHILYGIESKSFMTAHHPTGDGELCLWFPTGHSWNVCFWWPHHSHALAN